MDKRLKIVWGILSAALVAAGVLALVFFAPPYAAARGMADLFAKDHHLELFSPAFYARLRLPVLLLGLLSTVLGAASLAFARRSQAVLAGTVKKISPAWSRLSKDTKDLFRPALPREPGWVWLVLLGLTLLGLLARLPYILRPMTHDESYTFVTFAANTLQFATSDYSLPNNHIFHTILVHFSFLLFGNAPWAVRLPALIAGLLVIPAAFGLARRLYNREIALLAAALCAAAPVLVLYSVNARGYTLLALFTLLTFSLGTTVLRQNNSAAWLLIGVLGALGFYTVPVFLYPYGALFTWLALSFLFKDTGPGYQPRWHFFAWLIASGVVCVALTALLYLPVFMQSGVNSVIGNSTVEALPWGDFLQTLPHRLLETWNEWTSGVSPIFIALALAGLALSLVFHKRSSPVRVPPQAALALFLVPVVLIQRPNPWARIWLDLFPLFIIWTAAGWLAPLGGLRLALRRPLSLAQLIGALAAGVVLIASLARSASYLPNYGQPGPVEQIVQYMQANLKEGDVVVITEPDDAALWYYWRLYRLPQKFLQAKTQRFQQVYVLVNRPNMQTLQWVLADRGPDVVFVSLDTAHLVQHFVNDDLYVVDGNQRVMDKTFGAAP
jgi:4-amino-4-deoxy-L-arabinose transferase-like glycosyltransferase